MSDPAPPPQSNLFAALGRVPSGLFIVTLRHESRASGILASWVQQAGFEPPMISVAVRLDRYQLAWMRAAGGFTVNQLPVGSKALLKHFARGFEPEEPAFEGLALADIDASGPVLRDALAWLDAEIVGGVDSGDHRVVLGRVRAGGLLMRDVEPAVHIRREGSRY